MPRPKRPVVHFPGGKRGRDFMSERSITVTNPKINKGEVTNIPSVFGGVERTERDAVNRIHQSGGIDPENPHRGKLKSFGTPTQSNLKKAIKAAGERSAKFSKDRGIDTLKAELKGSGGRKGKSSKK